MFIGGFDLGEAAAAEEEEEEEEMSMMDELMADASSAKAVKVR